MRCEASVCGMVAQVRCVLYAVCAVCVVRPARIVGWVWGCDAMMRESGCEAVRVAVVRRVVGVPVHEWQ